MKIKHKDHMFGVIPSDGDVMPPSIILSMEAHIKCLEEVVLT